MGQPKKPDWRCVLCGDESTPKTRYDKPMRVLDVLVEGLGHCINCGYGVDIFDKNKANNRKEK